MPPTDGINDIVSQIVHSRANDLRNIVKKQLEEEEGLLSQTENILNSGDEDEKKKQILRVFRNVDESYGKKRLFVCCDGTWKSASGTIEPLTNVARLARSVARFGSIESKDEGYDYAQYMPTIPQVTYYSPGVGSQSASPIDSSLSGATGKGVTASILNAYCFLCNNYNFLSKRDEIILVGYSRGAFTVRCLAAFISDVGLIRRKKLPFLRAIFKRWMGDQDMRNSVKEMVSELNAAGESPCQFSSLVRIKVLAEWDTVSAMLSLRSHPLSFVQNEVPSAVENAFFALALHEKRPTFSPMIWRTCNRGTVVRQCAFMGCHGDVGGGNPDSGLSTISLLWMIAQIESVSFVKFDSEALFQLFTVFQSMPNGQKRDIGRTLWWPKSQSTQYVQNTCLSKGNIHETLSSWWKIPYCMSLGIWSGRRDKYLERYKSPEQLDPGIQPDATTCTLQIHFTVAVMLSPNPKANTPLSGSKIGIYTRFQRRGWKFTDKRYLWEANINTYERARLERWKKESAKDRGEPPSFWSMVIRGVVGRYDKYEGKVLINELWDKSELLGC